MDRPLLTQNQPIWTEFGGLWPERSSVT